LAHEENSGHALAARSPVACDGLPISAGNRNTFRGERLPPLMAEGAVTRRISPRPMRVQIHMDTMVRRRPCTVTVELFPGPTRALAT